ncbi:hypothetical protein PoB_002819800 [Plakobranchus ocellatus]|uniref:Uncharacterized protein n=1 Tax=Plakobranchus ocellatus TaxID=259542 RepID=A0AAV4A4X7_9GAST|nr:hypothetical protein PoB_002819800 [Plakobranchus ocellatus]
MSHRQLIYFTVSTQSHPHCKATPPPPPPPSLSSYLQSPYRAYEAVTPIAAQSPPQGDGDSVMKFGHVDKSTVEDCKIPEFFSHWSHPTQPVRTQRRPTGSFSHPLQQNQSPTATRQTGTNVKFDDGSHQPHQMHQIFVSPSDVSVGFVIRKSPAAGWKEGKIDEEKKSKGGIAQTSHQDQQEKARHFSTNCRKNQGTDPDDGNQRSVLGGTQDARVEACNAAYQPEHNMTIDNFTDVTCLDNAGKRLKTSSYSYSSITETESEATTDPGQEEPKLEDGTLRPVKESPWKYRSQPEETIGRDREAFARGQPQGLNQISDNYMWNDKCTDKGFTLENTEHITALVDDSSNLKGSNNKKGIHIFANARNCFQIETAQTVSEINTLADALAGNPTGSQEIRERKSYLVSSTNEASRMGFSDCQRIFSDIPKPQGTYDKLFAAETRRGSLNSHVNDISDGNYFKAEVYKSLHQKRTDANLDNGFYGTNEHSSASQKSSSENSSSRSFFHPSPLAQSYFYGPGKSRRLVVVDGVKQKPNLLVSPRSIRGRSRHVASGTGTQEASISPTIFQSLNKRKEFERSGHFRKNRTKKPSPNLARPRCKCPSLDKPGPNRVAASRAIFRKPWWNVNKRSSVMPSKFHSTSLKNQNNQKKESESPIAFGDVNQQLSLPHTFPVLYEAMSNKVKLFRRQYKRKYPFTYTDTHRKETTRRRDSAPRYHPYAGKGKEACACLQKDRKFEAQRHGYSLHTSPFSLQKSKPVKQTFFDKIHDKTKYVFDMNLRDEGKSLHNYRDNVFAFGSPSHYHRFPLRHTQQWSPKSKYAQIHQIGSLGRLFTIQPQHGQVFLMDTPHLNKPEAQRSSEKAVKKCPWTIHRNRCKPINASSSLSAQRGDSYAFRPLPLAYSPNAGFSSGDAGFWAASRVDSDNSRNRLLPMRPGLRSKDMIHNSLSRGSTKDRPAIRQIFEFGSDRVLPEVVSPSASSVCVSVNRNNQPVGSYGWDCLSDTDRDSLFQVSVSADTDSILPLSPVLKTPFTQVHFSPDTIKDKMKLDNTGANYRSEPSKNLFDQYSHVHVNHLNASHRMYRRRTRRGILSRHASFQRLGKRSRNSLVSFNGDSQIWTFDNIVGTDGMSADTGRLWKDQTDSMLFQPSKQRLYGEENNNKVSNVRMNRCGAYARTERKSLARNSIFKAENSEVFSTISPLALDSSDTSLKHTPSPGFVSRIVEAHADKLYSHKTFTSHKEGVLPSKKSEGLSPTDTRVEKPNDRAKTSSRQPLRIEKQHDQKAGSCHLGYANVVKKYMKNGKNIPSPLLSKSNFSSEPSGSEARLSLPGESAAAGNSTYSTVSHGPRLSNGRWKSYQIRKRHVKGESYRKTGLQNDFAKGLSINFATPQKMSIKAVYSTNLSNLSHTLTPVKGAGFPRVPVSTFTRTFSGTNKMAISAGRLIVPHVTKNLQSSQMLPKPIANPSPGPAKSQNAITFLPPTHAIDGARNLCNSSPSWAIGSSGAARPPVMVNSTETFLCSNASTSLETSQSVHTKNHQDVSSSVKKNVSACSSNSQQRTHNLQKSELFKKVDTKIEKSSTRIINPPKARKSPQTSDGNDALLLSKTFKTNNNKDPNGVLARNQKRTKPRRDPSTKNTGPGGTVVRWHDSPQFQDGNVQHDCLPLRDDLFRMTENNNPLNTGEMRVFPNQNSNRDCQNGPELVKPQKKTGRRLSHIALGPIDNLSSMENIESLRSGKKIKNGELLPRISSPKFQHLTLPVQNFQQARHTKSKSHQTDDGKQVEGYIELQMSLNAKGCLSELSQPSPSDGNVSWLRFSSADSSSNSRNDITYNKSSGDPDNARQAPVTNIPGQANKLARKHFLAACNSNSEGKELQKGTSHQETSINKTNISRVSFFKDAQKLVEGKILFENSGNKFCRASPSQNSPVNVVKSMPSLANDIDQHDNCLDSFNEDRALMSEGKQDQAPISHRKPGSNFPFGHGKANGGNVFRIAGPEIQTRRLTSPERNAHKSSKSPIVRTNKRGTALMHRQKGRRSPAYKGRGRNVSEPGTSLTDRALSTNNSASVFPRGSTTHWCHLKISDKMLVLQLPTGQAQRSHQVNDSSDASFVSNSVESNSGLIREEDIMRPVAQHQSSSDGHVNNDWVSTERDAEDGPANSPEYNLRSPQAQGGLSFDWYKPAARSQDRQRSMHIERSRRLQTPASHSVSPTHPARENKTRHEACLTGQHPPSRNPPTLLTDTYEYRDYQNSPQNSSGSLHAACHADGLDLPSYGITDRLRDTNTSNFLHSSSSLPFNRYRVKSMSCSDLPTSETVLTSHLSYIEHNRLYPDWQSKYPEVAHYLNAGIKEVQVIPVVEAELNCSPFLEIEISHAINSVSDDEPEPEVLLAGQSPGEVLSAFVDDSIE